MSYVPPSKTGRIARRFSDWWARELPDGFAGRITGMPHVVAGSQIMREIVPKKGHGARESFAQRDLRLPFQNRPNATVVCIVIADVNAFAVRRKGTDLVSSAAVHFDEQISKIL